MLGRLACSARWRLPGRRAPSGARQLAGSAQAAPEEPPAGEGRILLHRLQGHVAHLELDQPRAKNAFSMAMGQQLVSRLDELEADPWVRCVLLSGRGADFCAGLDLKSFMAAYGRLEECEDVARKARLLLALIKRFQAPFKRLHSFGKPLACVHHGLCLGLAMELAACADLRLCSADARMAVREVVMGIAPDVGSLQLLPRLVNNQSRLRELVFTGRYWRVEEALELGFVSQIEPTKEAAFEAALKLAQAIASRSPVAVQGCKRNLAYSADKSLADGLDYNAVWNMAMMQTEDVPKSVAAIFSKSDEHSFQDF